MTASEKILKVFLAVQIILATSTAINYERYSQGVNNSSRKAGQIIELKSVEDEFKLHNEDDVENEYSNEDSAIPSELDETGKKSHKFKYAVDKKDEPGFFLTSEEMKTFKIWRDGVIPYYIDVVSFSDKVLRDKIRNFLQMVNSLTSVNFVELPGPPADENERWVFFINRRGLLGCADHTVKNFTDQGVQQVVLGYDCMTTRGEIAEAVMSIVGVPAQHNAPDRDKYIKVNIENVMADKKYLFEKLTDREWLFHDLPYDFDSVTHYDINKYSANGRATIEQLNNSDDLKSATELSANDVLKIKMLYNYMTRNKIMQAPVCEKLFKISNQYRPSPMKKRIKPRKKPNQYTGVSGTGVYESNEKTENSALNEGKKNKQEGINNKNGEKYDDNAAKYALNNDEYYDEDYSYEDTGKLLSSEVLKAPMHKFQQKKVREEREKKILKGRYKAKQKMVDLLHNLSDDQSGDIVRLKAKKLKGPIKDPLVLLSDYETIERLK